MPCSLHAGTCGCYLPWRLLWCKRDHACNPQRTTTCLSQHTIYSILLVHPCGRLVVAKYPLVVALLYNYILILAKYPLARLPYIIYISLYSTSPGTHTHTHPAGTGHTLTSYRPLFCYAAAAWARVCGQEHSDCCPLRPRTTPFPEGKSIQGVIYGVLL